MSSTTSTPLTYDQGKASQQAGYGLRAGWRRANRAAQIKSVCPTWRSSTSVQNEQQQVRLDTLVLPIEGQGAVGHALRFPRPRRVDRAHHQGDHVLRPSSETPGLGGEVDNPRWKALWPGRQAVRSRRVRGRRSTVIKGPAGPVAEDPYHVDGLSGATITSSRGVTQLVQFLAR